MGKAQCLCGAVEWDTGPQADWMSHCHCSRCRKAHGSGFATYVASPADAFRLRGADAVARFESSQGFARCFCRHCGSVVPGDAFDGRIFSPAGNFLDDPGARPAAHIFTGSKAPWLEIADDLARFDTYPEGIDAPVLPDRPPLDPAGGVRGSCLCGGVTFVLEGASMRCWNCHCGRCRRARSAAHASNLFTAIDALRFTRGEDLLVSYKVPEALRFTQVFCRVCGSSMPRRDPQRALAIAPMGVLDDDPGIRPERHIFTDSKAPWFSIADSLPQHPEYPEGV